MPNLTSHMPLAALDATLAVALAMCAAVAAALPAKYVRFLPLVTSYIVAGIVIGPHVLKLVSQQQVQQLTPVRDIALAVILFTIGTRFELATFRRLARWLASWGAWDIVLIGLAVAVSMTWLIGSWQLAVLAAIIAMEIAPAATFLVLRETASSGMLTRLVLNAVVANNVVVIIIFSLVYPTIEVISYNQPWSLLLTGPLAVGGCLAIGLAVGVALSVLEQKYESDAERLLLLFGAILLTLGLARLFGFQPFLIAPLAAGAVLGNSSGKTEHVRSLIERIDPPFYVIFFIVAEASLHLEYLWQREVAIAAGGYVLLRTAARLAAGWLGGRGKAIESRVLYWFPPSLLSHSALAIALVAVVVGHHRGDRQFEELQAIVLTAVAIFEIGAPVILKFALTQAGEVTVAHHLQRGEGIADLGAWRQVIHRLGVAAGLSSTSQDTGRIDQANLEQLIIRDVAAVHIDHPYSKVLGFISHSRYDCFPVVDGDGYYVGFISYFHVRDASFDPALSSLIIAGDMMVTGSELHIDRDSPQALADKFSITNTTWLPVVRAAKEDPDKLTLVGMMEGRPLMRYILANSQAAEQVTADSMPEKPTDQGRNGQ